MKLIHTADIHLGSSMKSNFNSQKAAVRKEELFNAFIKMLNYAKENSIKIVLISGDLFDIEKRAVSKTMKIIEKYHDITFFYVKGNHDKQIIENAPNNLVIFDKKFSFYKIDNICIGGVETYSYDFYDQIKFPIETFNILLLHGNITSSIKEIDDINLNRLKNINIDYLALGHIHKFERIVLDKRGVGCYPGCLEGRGFDELSEKGFVVFDIETREIKFIENSNRVIREVFIDLTNASNIFSHILNELEKYPQKDIIKVILTGSIKIDTDIDEEIIKSKLDEIFFGIKIENRTTLEIDYKNYINEVSLQGEFVRTVLKDNSLDDEKRDKILLFGLKSLLGEDQ